VKQKLVGIRTVVAAAIGLEAVTVTGHLVATGPPTGPTGPPTGPTGPPTGPTGGK